MDLFKDVRGGNSRIDHKYTKTKAELKYFIELEGRDTSATLFPYISVEGMYFPQHYMKVKDWIHGDRASYSYAFSNIKRTAWVASLKYGMEKRHKRTVLDFYVGLGVRKIAVSHQATGVVEEEYYGPADLEFQSIDRYEGTFYRPHVSLGVKLGYIIK